MLIVALKHLPQGQTPGTLVDVPDAAGRLFVTIQAARAATDQETQQHQAQHATAAAAPQTPSTSPASGRRGQYRDRSMRARA
jgi:hypothetical protein